MFNEKVDIVKIVKVFFLWNCFLIFLLGVVIFFGNRFCSCGWKCLIVLLKLSGGRFLLLWICICLELGVKFNLCYLSLFFVFYFVVFYGKFFVEVIVIVVKKLFDFLGCVVRIVGW